jgi:hypothetical protein
MGRSSSIDYRYSVENSGLKRLRASWDCRSAPALLGQPTIRKTYRLSLKEDLTGIVAVGSIAQYCRQSRPKHEETRMIGRPLARGIAA